MEKYVLHKSITVFYVEATSFPDGIQEAHRKLHALLMPVAGRRFYGISYPDKDGVIIYKAAVEESFAGEGQKYHCETFTIPRGEYISEVITDWQRNPGIISNTFRQLLRYPGIAKNGFCLEQYISDNDIRCLVPLSADIRT